MAAKGYAPVISKSDQTSTEPVPVRLNVYDVCGGVLVQRFNSLLYPLGLGAFHAGVEVYDMEFSFAYNTQRGATGVYCSPPRKSPSHSYRLSVDMGFTEMTLEQVRLLLQRLKAEYPSNRYHILRRNCCHFSDELCRLLGVGPLPSWVLNLAGGAALLSSFGGAVLCRNVQTAESLTEKREARAQKFSEMDLYLLENGKEDSPLKGRDSMLCFKPSQWPPARGYHEAFNGWHTHHQSEEWLYKPCSGIFFHSPTETLWKRSLTNNDEFVQIDTDCESPALKMGCKASADERALLRVCVTMWNWQVRKFQNMEHDLAASCNVEEAPIRSIRTSI
jgi:hypothetical protein